MQGIGPLTGALEAFANFFVIDPDLVQAAAELEADKAPRPLTPIPGRVLRDACWRKLLRMRR